LNQRVYCLWALAALLSKGLSALAKRQRRSNCEIRKAEVGEGRAQA
jgi:hypothetical protein